MKKCSKCKIEKPLAEYNKNKSTKDGLSYECKTCTKKWRDENKDKRDQWKKKNSEKLSVYRKTYNKKFPDKQREAKNNYMKRNIERFRLRNNLSKRLREALKNNQKKGKTLELIGCSITDLKSYLQQSAINNGYKNFNINSYSGYEYHIDHIVPCDAFNLKCSYHQKLCFHWSNLQILTTQENLKKNKMLDQ